MTVRTTDSCIDIARTTEQLALLHYAAQAEAQRFVEAVTRLAATNPDKAEQIIHNLVGLTNNTQSFGTETAVHTLDLLSDRSNQGGLHEEDTD
ncbi:hypothetical protein [Herpetosiphon geysericola]|uniref:Uncharacterized protein n=1 Tax=Herpetosiphon geysericola TaxID=70996 RepID=A0A0P6XCB2_9CHLR|nr:hypothetical protein [Herpetosiphon geysericola]KPL79987.1 hypothetical protein SE18_25720 [Herpetosiphon geysericola]